VSNRDSFEEKARKGPILFGTAFPTVHLLEVPGRIVARISSESRRRELVKRGEALWTSCSDVLAHKESVDLLTARCRSLLKISRDPEYRLHLLQTGDLIHVRV